MNRSDVSGLSEGRTTGSRGNYRQSLRWLRAAGATLLGVLVGTVIVLLLIVGRLVPLLPSERAEGPAAASSGAAVQPCC